MDEKEIVSDHKRGGGFGVSSTEKDFERGLRFSFSQEEDDDSDKTSHSLFCQMNVLNEEGTTWKETSRWLVYEEKLEDSDRWSKPHMPTTSFNALEEVRRGLAEQTVALNLKTDCGCLHEFAMVIAKHQKLSDDQLKKLTQLLKKPHIRGYDTNITNIKNKQSKQKDKQNSSLQKKMQAGTEAANILVGKVDFLQEPLLAFARLGVSEKLSELTEVDLPTKFIFLVLSPKKSEYEQSYYEDIGRSMAQLMTDKVYGRLIYKAQRRQHLLEGIDEFKTHLTVLPPSIWDPNTRLDPPEEKIEMDKIKQRLNDRRWSVSLSFERQENEIDYQYQDNKLIRTGRPFGGLIADIKRRYNWRTMLSDYKDGFHVQSVASIIFLYFACITPIVTFGGLLGAATDNYMGTMETIMSGAVCGILFAIFAGQPLSIVGATGPLLVFETMLYTFCRDNNLNFLPFRCWIGLWTMFYLIIVVATDLSALIQYITRFTEECFATLISLIFIYQAFKKLGTIWNTHPLHSHAVDESVDFKCHCVHPPYDTNSTVNGTQTADASLSTNGDDPYHTSDHAFFEEHDWQKLVYEDCITYEHRLIVDTSCISEQDCITHGWILDGPACNVHTVTHSVPDVFLLSVLLCLGTYFVAAFFRDLRHKNYLTLNIRNLLSDFAIFISVVVCTGIDFLLSVDTPKLHVPSSFKNTRDDRGWVVNPLDLDRKWLIIAAAVPALLATILIFLDQQITAIIVNRKEHKLKKGHGYHLDLLVLSILVGLCSILGIPWFVAATVAAITHVNTLKQLSDISVPGEKPFFIGTRETRVTGLLTHVLIGVSVLFTSILKHIPMAVLYGVFLYMGVCSLDGMQFVDRILLMFSPVKYQADLPFLRHVKLSKVHVFTIVQIGCMIVMWIFKSIKAIALLFPLVILAPAVVRKILERFYNYPELFWLDELLPGQSIQDKNDKPSKDKKEDKEDANHNLNDKKSNRNGMFKMFRRRKENGKNVELQPLNETA